MNERDLHESMIKLNPSYDKLGRDRDFKENMYQSIRHVIERIESIERRLDETTK